MGITFAPGIEELAAPGAGLGAGEISESEERCRAGHSQFLHRYLTRNGRRCRSAFGLVAGPQ